MKKYSTTLKKVAVEIDGKPYTLRELNGADRSVWLHDIMGRAMFDAEGKVTAWKDISGLDLILLPLCLYDKDGKPMPAKVLGMWPPALLDDLFQQAQDLSGFSIEGDKALKAEAKNS